MLESSGGPDAHVKILTCTCKKPVIFSVGHYRGQPSSSVSMVVSISSQCTEHIALWYEQIALQKDSAEYLKMDHAHSNQWQALAKQSAQSCHSRRITDSIVVPMAS